MPIIVRNASPFRVGFLPARLSYPGHEVAVVVKGTFRFEHGAPAELVPADEQRHLSGDVLTGNEREAGIYYPSDFSPFKPRADVVLVGTCHTPGGAPLERAAVGLEVGTVKKRVAVVGDREWGQGPDGVAIAGRPRPFTTMPLVWERAFGGPGFADNPIGAGLSTKLPNLEHPERPLAHRGQRPAPVGLGPIDRRRPARMRHVGTYDDLWRKERWPHFPSDFDYAYFNAAPEDQRPEGYLAGDEAVVLEGLDPAHHVVETRLPGVRSRCVLRRVDGALEDVEMRLDTLWIDADAKRLVLVWRGFGRTSNKTFDDIDSLFIAVEGVDRPARSPEEIVAHHSHTDPSGDGAAVAQDQLDEPADEPPRARASARPDGEGAETADSEGDAATMADAVSLLEQGNAPSDLVARARASRTLNEMLDVLSGALPEAKEGVGEAELASAQAQGREVLDASGADGSALGAEEMPTPPPTGEAGPLSREEVERRVRDGETLAGADLRGLDLRGIDLSTVSLQRAALDGCNLEGARLAEADLTEASAARARFDRADLRGAILLGARLHEASLVAADLRGASASTASAPRVTLSRANLEGADFASADLRGATMDEACLRGARFDEASLAQATLSRVDGGKARLSSACLDGARLDGATLDGANLRGASIEGVTFEGASLKEASLEGAHGRGVTFRGADLSAVRGAEASLEGARLERARGAGSIWTGASLERACFDRASLDRADFTEAKLTGASFDLAVLKYASFVRAALVDAVLTKANLFRSSLEGADMTGADVRGSNLFECELLDATTLGTRFERANLKRTKLSLEAS